MDMTTELVNLARADYGIFLNLAIKEDFHSLCILLWKNLDKIRQWLAQKNDLGQTVIHLAVYRNSKALFEFLLMLGADIETREEDSILKRRPLNIAACSGYEDTVRFLLERKADVQSADRLQQTALHWAAKKGFESIAKLLVENGADIEAKTVFGHPPLYWAASNKQEKIIKLLLAEGADIRALASGGHQIDPLLLPPSLAERINAFYEELKVLQPEVTKSYYLPKARSSDSISKPSLIRNVIDIQEKWFLFYIAAWKKLEKFLMLSEKNSDRYKYLPREIKDRIIHYTLIDILIVHEISFENSKILTKLLQYQWINKDNFSNPLERKAIAYIQALQNDSLAEDPLSHFFPWVKVHSLLIEPNKLSKITRRYSWV